MKRIEILFMLMLCLNISVLAQKDILERRVNVQYIDVELNEVLIDLKTRYGVNFSYSSTNISLNRKVSVKLNNVTLKEALDTISSRTYIEYQQVGNSIVLKKSKQIPNKEGNNDGSFNSRSTNIQLVSISDYDPSLDEDTVIHKDQLIGIVPELKLEVIEISDSMISNEMEVDSVSIPESMDRETARKWYLTEKKRLKLEYDKKLDSINSINKEKSKLVESLNRSVRKIDREFLDLQIKWNERYGKKEQDSSFNLIEPDSGFVYKNSQFSFISPLGTNGELSARTINKYSFNLLYGSHAGFEAAELGVINRNTHHINGVQFAFLTNISEGDVFALQMAGIGNLNNGNSGGAQFSGLFNFNSSYFTGIQFAGFANLTEAYVKGAQFAGFMNMAGDNTNAIQAAGFMNICAGSVDGGQIAGFMNLSSLKVQGVQISSIFNVSGGLKGVQVGLLNFTDSISDKSIQLGLLSIPGRNGLYDFELAISEALFSTMEYRMGSRGLYNIFGTGYQSGIDAKERFGIGYGLGTQMRATKRLAIHFEVDAYQIKEPELSFFDELNLLNQGRLKFGIGLTKHISLMVGPSFNVMTSKLKNENGAFIGSGFAPEYLLLYNKAEADAHVKLWVGGQVGMKISL